MYAWLFKSVGCSEAELSKKLLLPAFGLASSNSKYLCETKTEIKLQINGLSVCKSISRTTGSSPATAHQWGENIRCFHNHQFFSALNKWPIICYSTSHIAYIEECCFISRRCFMNCNLIFPLSYTETSLLLFPERGFKEFTLWSLLLVL